MTSQVWGLLTTVLTLILGPGGVAVVWLSMKKKRDSEPVFKQQATEARAEALVSDTGIGAQWRDLVDTVQKHADDIERRLTARLDAQQLEITELQRKHRLDRRLVSSLRDYVMVLRDHISNQLPPPPPDPNPPLVFDDDGVYRLDYTEDDPDRSM